MISSALCTALLFQILTRKVGAEDSNNKNSIRGRRESSDSIKEYSEEFYSATNTHVRKTRTRNLVEEDESSDLDSDENKFPYLASLMDESFRHICAGTLIANDMLLTAASCMDKATLNYVQFQDGIFQDDSPIEILTTFPNPEYNEITGEQNTMLVKLTNPVESLTSPSIASNMLVQVLLNDAEASRPSNWPVSILNEGQTLTGFNYLQPPLISNDYISNDVISNDYISNDFSNYTSLEGEWGEWQLEYIGKDSCRAKIASSPEYQKLFGAEDGFCVERRDVQLFATSSGSSNSCHPREIGGPILWKSDTTGARLLLGVNTWGIGCRKPILPDIASMANAGRDFIRKVICAQSASPPAYIRCPTTPVATEEKEPPHKPNRVPLFSSEFSVFFGAPQRFKKPPKPSKMVKNINGHSQKVGPIAVYLLLLFDSDTAENISWTIREESTKNLAAFAFKGTYTDQTHYTDLVELTPGKTYEMELIDDTYISERDRVRGMFMDFAMVVSDPAEEIVSGKIRSGTRQSFEFTVPVASNDALDVTADVLQEDIPPPPSDAPSDNPDENPDIETLAPTSSVSEAPSITPTSCGNKHSTIMARLKEVFGEDNCAEKTSPTKQDIDCSIDVPGWFTASVTYKSTLKIVDDLTVDFVPESIEATDTLFPDSPTKLSSLFVTSEFGEGECFDSGELGAMLDGIKRRIDNPDEGPCDDQDADIVARLNEVFGEENCAGSTDKKESVFECFIDEPGQFTASVLYQSIDGIPDYLEATDAVVVEDGQEISFAAGISFSEPGDCLDDSELASTLDSIKNRLDGSDELPCDDKDSDIVARLNEVFGEGNCAESNNLNEKTLDCSIDEPGWFTASSIYKSVDGVPTYIEATDAVRIEEGQSISFMVIVEFSEESDCFDSGELSATLAGIKNRIDNPDDKPCNDSHSDIVARLNEVFGEENCVESNSVSGQVLDCSVAVPDWYTSSVTYTSVEGISGLVPESIEAYDTLFPDNPTQLLSLALNVGFSGQGDCFESGELVATLNGIKERIDNPDDKPPIISSESPVPAPATDAPEPSAPPAPSCVAKGGSCNSGADCCSGRCSPFKICFPSSRGNRVRISSQSHGGAAQGQISNSRFRRFGTFDLVHSNDP